MLTYFLFAVGIILLIKGADWLVDGSSSLAKKLGIPTIVIGLTIVAFGTSMPELVVNVISAIKHNGGIAFGNIIGSNIANILLILGVSTLISDIKVQKSTTWKEIPFSFLAILVLLIFSNTVFLDNISINVVTRFEGMILLLFFAIFLYYVFELSRKKSIDISHDDIEIKKHSSLQIFLLISGGLFCLYMGGKWTVEGAIQMARYFGLSEYFIGLTIVAVGTSLPELVTSIIASLKKHNDIVIGNVIGSNIFNIFWILGLTALIYPFAIPANVNFDLIVLLLTTMLLFLFMLIGKKHRLEKWQGIVFLFMYVFYIIFLIKRG